jgi:hypothetical protein
MTLSSSLQSLPALLVGPSGAISVPATSQGEVPPLAHSTEWKPRLGKRSCWSMAVRRSGFWGFDVSMRIEVDPADITSPGGPR